MPLPACQRLKPVAGNVGQVAQVVMFYTYVLKSKVDAKLYIGWTDNLKKRLKDHNDGKVIATKGRIPFSLIYYECCLVREKAILREKYFKSGSGRNFLKNRI